MDVAWEMEAFRRALRQRGLAATRQRLGLAETVFSTHQHLSADEICVLAKRRGLRVGRVTVYRTLKTMVEAGLVEERPFSKDRVLYEHTIGHAHHDHMVCLDCHRVVEFRSPRIEEEQERIARRHGFALVHHSHTLFGRCSKCAARRS